jgi:CheY-like chemotaxis protein
MAALVLLVEDVEDNRALARFVLAAMGLEVVEARCGAEALARAAERRPDLVLMDLSLPQMDGYEAAERLRTLPGLAAVPILAVTAHAMAGDREKVLAAGFDGYLTKPLDLKAFRAAVTAALQG